MIEAIRSFVARRTSGRRSYRGTIEAALRELDTDLGAQNVRRICAVFLEDTKLRLERLADAIRSNDMVRFRAEAHAVRGSLGNFRASRAVEAWRSLELDADESRLSDNFAIALREVRLVQHVVRTYSCDQVASASASRQAAVARTP